MGKIIIKKELQRVEVMVPPSRLQGSKTVKGQWEKNGLSKDSATGPEYLASSQLSQNFNSPEKCLQLCRIT